MCTSLLVFIVSFVLLVCTGLKPDGQDLGKMVKFWGKNVLDKLIWSNMLYSSKHSIFKIFSVFFCLARISIFISGVCCSSISSLVQF